MPAGTIPHGLFPNQELPRGPERQVVRVDVLTPTEPLQVFCVQQPKLDLSPSRLIKAQRADVEVVELHRFRFGEVLLRQAARQQVGHLRVHGPVVIEVGEFDTHHLIRRCPSSHLVRPDMASEIQERDNHPNRPSDFPNRAYSIPIHALTYEAV